MLALSCIIDGGLLSPSFSLLLVSMMYTKALRLSLLAIKIRVNVRESAARIVRRLVTRVYWESADFIMLRIDSNSRVYGYARG